MAAPDSRFFAGGKRVAGGGRKNIQHLPRVFERPKRFSTKSPLAVSTVCGNLFSSARGLFAASAIFVHRCFPLELGIIAAIFLFLRKLQNHTA